LERLALKRVPGYTGFRVGGRLLGVFSSICCLGGRCTGVGLLAWLGCCYDVEGYVANWRIYPEGRN